ncbi:MAG: aminotransferase class V-fold PLP-dependent enzyme [Planctomycetota bacterium]
MGVYDDLGISPIINVSGSVTRLGGAPLTERGLAAFEAAARECVPIDQLQGAASRRIAALTGAESGLVTSGAADALTLGAAAILAGHDLGRMERLPDTTGMRREFIIAREQRNGYDHAVRAAGAILVEAGFHELVAGAGVRRCEAWEIEAAIGPNTAGILYVHDACSRPPMAEVVAVARRHGLPLLVDAAGELPPRENLRSIVAVGADLVAFSGGKAIRGPQATGILCCRRDLVASAALQMFDMDDHFELWEPPLELIDKTRLRGLPRHGIGRSMKVSKEQIVALLAALEDFAAGVYDRDLPVFHDYLQSIASALSGSTSGASASGASALSGSAVSESQATDLPVECHWPKVGRGCVPVLELALDERRLGRTALEVCRRLRRGVPPVYVGHGKLDEGRLVIHPLHLNAERLALLIDRLRQELTPSPGS